MEILWIVAGIILFALATSILYIIGLKKKLQEDRELTEKLINNAALRVLDYLKQHESISADQISYIIKDIKARNFYSNKTAVIKDGKVFRYQVIQFMTENNYLIKDTDYKGRILYKLSSKKEQKNE